MVVGAQVVGAAVGARQDGEDFGAPITAIESSTAKGNARFFAVEAGAEALFCVEEIEWTIVDVDAMVEGWRPFWFCASAGRTSHCRLQVKHEAEAHDETR